MKNLTLNAWERLMLSQCLPQSGPLQQIAVYLRILETLRLKEDEREAVGWQENPETGTATIQGATHEFDIALEDADLRLSRSLLVRGRASGGACDGAVA
jgi:hypothetical protein